MPKVLVVDDDPVQRNFIATLLRQDGHEVLEAENGSAALALADQNLPDLVMTDILMPVMDGYELALRLCADHRPPVRIIFYTAAYPRPEVLALAEECGVSRVLSMPAKRETILEAVRSALEKPVSEAKGARASFHESHARLLTQKVFDELKQLQDVNERLRVSESQYRALFETNPLPMWIVDADTQKIVAVNNAAVRHYGYSADEFTALARTDISLSADEHSLLDQALPSIGGFLPVPGKRRHRTKNGDVIEVEVFSQATSFNGRPAQLSLVQDVTERNRADLILQTSEIQLQKLTARMCRAQEEERTRVARYLHDELGQMLTALRLTCTSILARLGSERPELHDQLRGCMALADKMVVAVQTLSTDLRPGSLDIGIGAAIEWHSRNFQSRSGIACSVKLPKTEPPLEPAVATEMYRIFQEALTNVARHANATRVNIALTQKPSGLLLELHDNGRGIRPEQIKSRDAIGLVGMRERANLIGASLSFEGEPGQGTTIRLMIPHSAAIDPAF